jgi:hypothetical protein
VPVRIDHSRHEDAAGRIDLGSSLGHCQVRSHRGDALATDQDVGAVKDMVGIVHGQDSGVPEHH